MPVHSLILSTTEGNPLFSKYYDRDTLRTPDGSLIFEQHLRNHTSFNWRKAAFSKQTVTISNVHVVYKQFDEILIFASGTSDVDESVCKILFVYILI